MAMYAPSAALAAVPQMARHALLLPAGCVLLGTGALAFGLSTTVGGFSTAAALIGIAWSLIMLGTTLWIHKSGQVSRWLLGLHDGALLTGAVLGAFTAHLFA